MKKLTLLSTLVVLLLLAGCQPEGQQLDTAARGAKPGQEKTEKDQQSGNNMMGPTQAVAD